MEKMNKDMVNILGVDIFSFGWDEFIKKIKIILRSKKRYCYIISATSVHGVIEAQSDRKFKRIFQKQYITYADGLPLKIIGRIAGEKKIEQIKGPEVLPEVCKLTSTINIKHFFYGGKEGTADKLALNLIKRYPGLKVVGTYCPPFRELTETEKIEITDIINKSRADIVWVGLSTPKQEKWADEFSKYLNTKIIFTVGAAFDFHTGGIKFAPAWVSRIGLEWLFRLILEPKRLWPRYSRIVPKFIWLSILQILKVKKY